MWRKIRNGKVKMDIFHIKNKHSKHHFIYLGTTFVAHKQTDMFTFWKIQ